MQKFTDTKVNKKLLIWTILVALSSILTTNASGEFFHVKTKFILYVTIKAVVILLIAVFWWYVIELFVQIKNKNKKIIAFTKYFLVYFLIMLFFLLLTWPRNI